VSPRGEISFSFSFSFSFRRRREVGTLLLFKKTNARRDDESAVSTQHARTLAGSVERVRFASRGRVSRRGARASWCAAVGESP